MSEITFGTDGWRARLETFTEPRVRQVGRAVATYLDDEGFESAPVAVGYDARSSSPGFARALAEELSDAGHTVYLPDRDCPTPLLAWAIRDRGLAGGLMVTASHNPAEYNGVKFVPEDGAPALPTVTDAIEARLGEDPPVREGGEIHRVDFVRPHAEQVLDRVTQACGDSLGLHGLDVVYDAMHGSGRGVTDAVLERAGASVHRVRCDRHPDFGGTPPEPSPEHLGPLVDAVEDRDADLGIANDGDADRVAVVTPERGVLDENLLFAALYDFLLQREDGPAVRTVSTTFLIDRIAEAHGESVRECAVGFKWVADAMADTDALIGGEESGGFSIRGHVREKDGVLAGLLAAAMTAERAIDDRLDDIAAEHGAIYQSKVSVDCPDDRKQDVIEALGEEIPETVAGQRVESVDDTDGFKLLLEDGSWLLVRPSGTEPKMRVYAEGESEERVEELLEAGRERVEPLV
jgi:phosphomannomutase